MKIICGNWRIWSKVILIFAAISQCTTPLPASSGMHGAAQRVHHLWPPDSSGFPFHNKLRWGPYTLTVDALSVDNERFRIMTRSGKIVREIRTPHISDIDTIRLGRNVPDDLSVSTSPTGNALNERKQYFFTRRHGVCNVLVVDGCIYDEDNLLGQIRDLNGDGRAELITDSPAPLEYFPGICHACAPSVMLVIGWNGKRYVLQNRRYSWIARRKARYYQDDFLDSRNDPNESDEHRFSDAMGYYANLWTIGQGKEARRWLKRNLSAAVWQRFVTSFPEINGRLASLPRLITVSQQKVFNTTPAPSDD